jgi:type I restriction enzyme, S subunit
VKLQAYQRTKPSGVEWLGDVPDHWEVTRLRRLVSSLEQGWSPNANNYPASEDEVGVLKLGAARQGKFDSSENKAFDESLVGFRPITPQKGDLLVSRANTPELVGDACLVDADYPNRIIPDLIYRLRLNSAAHSPFFCWFLISRACRAQIETDARGSSGSMVKLGQGHISAWLCPKPPMAEQQAIAAFLDRETGRIDRLMAKKRELIERLKEKRIALISRTVTHGLPPEASAKADLPVNPLQKLSGLDWLGDIPKHWEFKKLRYLCEITTGDKDTVDAVEGGEFPFFVRSQTVERIDSYSFDCEAVLTAGDGVGVGKVFHHHQGKFAVHQRVYVLHNFRKVSGRYLFMFMREFFARVALGGEAKSTVDSLRRPIFTDFVVLLPPLHEQTAIVAYLDAETAKLDALVGKVEEAVERLQEYRTALITAAVTGKIDVREVVTP